MNMGKQASATANMTQMSKANKEGATTKPAPPATTPLMPRHPKMLKIQLPTTLPTAISRSPLRAAAIEVATSGMEVPAATMVSAITTSLTPSALAKTTAALTSQSEPSTKNTKPTNISANCAGSLASQAPGAGA